ncbi:hypothetical protein H8356DRAFT_1322423 [Neocallimastix lanati (nom. inval.)]|nr:hypothetical protein H8356DRAFT_1322423 [Neocallimastix sp. JGI-2020a]
MQLKYDSSARESCISPRHGLTRGEERIIEPPVSPLNISDFQCKVNMKKHSLNNGLLISNFLNHQRGNNNYTNPLIDQIIITGIPTMASKHQLHL